MIRVLGQCRRFVLISVVGVAAAIATPTPTPTPKLPKLPEQHPSKDCLPATSAGKTEYIEGEFNGVTYNVKMAVVQGVWKGSPIAVYAPNAGISLHCAYALASHTAPTAESSISINFEVASNRIDSLDDSPLIGGQLDLIKCNESITICKLPTTIFGLPHPGWQHIILAASVHKFVTVEVEKKVPASTCFSNFGPEPCEDRGFK